MKTKRHVVIDTTILVGILLAMGHGTHWAARAAEPEKGVPVVNLVPGSGSVPGWIIAEAPQVYSPETLYRIVNGAAGLYLSYGFQALAHARYEHERDSSFNITLDLFDMGTVEGGFGVYSSGRRATETFLPVGTQAYRTGSQFVAWKGRYYLTLMGDDVRAETLQGLEALAREITAKIPGPDVYPALLRRLPAPGRMPNTEKYIAKDFLGYEFLRNAASATYQVRSTTAEIFVADCSTNKQAQDIFQQLRDALGAPVELPAPVTASSPASYAAINPYMGKFLISLQEPYVFGVYAEKETADWNDMVSLLQECRIMLRKPT